jgi:hypothetical protein
MTILVCPINGCDLQGPPIPERPGEHYSNAVMVEVSSVYDGGLYFLCPECGQKWHRWPKGHPLHVRAEEYINV